MSLGPPKTSQTKPSNTGISQADVGPSVTSPKGADVATGDVANGEFGALSGTMNGKNWTIRARLRLIALIIVSLVLAPVQSFMLRFMPKFWWPCAGMWHRLFCRILGLRIETIGTRVRVKPVLWVANHISWIDIFMLGSRLPYASFVAKAEIKSWGFAAWLAGLHKTLYVKRERRTDSKRQRDAMMARLSGNDSLIMFPEATSTEGMQVIPFRSSLFSVAELADEASGHTLKIQPITISYGEMNGIPLVRSLKPRVAWLGDIDLLTHIKEFLSQKRTIATIEYHDPVSLAEVGDRKKLALYCHSQIRAGLDRANRMEWRMGPQKE